MKRYAVKLMLWLPELRTGSLICRQREAISALSPELVNLFRIVFTAQMKHDSRGHLTVSTFGHRRPELSLTKAAFTSAKCDSVGRCSRTNQEIVRERSNISGISFLHRRNLMRIWKFCQQSDSISLMSM